MFEIHLKYFKGLVSNLKNSLKNSAKLTSLICVYMMYINIYIYIYMYVDRKTNCKNISFLIFTECGSPIKYS